MKDERPYRKRPGEGFDTPLRMVAHGGELVTEEEKDRRTLHASQVENEKARRAAKREADKDEAGLRKIEVVSADTITPEATQWLWRPYGDSGMPLGDLSVLVGKGGAAKSQILCWFCARISRGELEGDLHGIPRTVFYLYREDSVQRTIVPRLIAAGADLSMVKFIRVTFLDDPNAQIRLPGDLDMLADTLTAHNAAACVYDPLSSHLEVKDSNSAAVMRSVYERIRQMHEDTDTTGLGLGHLRKQPAGSLLDAFMGSSEQGNVVRNGWGVHEKPDLDGPGGEYILSQEKNNLAPRATSLTYTIEGTMVWREGVEIGTSRVVFTGQTQETVSDLLRDQLTPGYSSKIEEAMAWLTPRLRDKGEVPVRELKEEAQDNKINGRTLQRAAGRLNVIINRYGDPGHFIYTWRAP